MDPRRTQLELRHATVSVLEWRPRAETGMPVLLLHGGGADSAELSWAEVGPAIAAAGHRVLAPDHPGFGRSPHADWSLTQERLVRHVGEIVDALGLVDYAIAGLSLGGGMTVGHLLDRPGRARAAMLLGCYGLMPRLADGFFGPAIHITSFALLCTGLLTAMTRASARSRSAMERALKALVRDPRRRTPELIDAVLTEAATGTGLTTFEEWQRDQVLWNRLRTVYTDELSSIPTRTLLVHGDHDSGVPIARIRAAAALLPAGALRTIPGAGHWVQRDRPDLVIPAMLDHLRRSADASTAHP